jgi:hypothetical protein
LAAPGDGLAQDPGQVGLPLPVALLPLFLSADWLTIGANFA